MLRGLNYKILNKEDKKVVFMIKIWNFVIFNNKLIDILFRGGKLFINEEVKSRLIFNKSLYCL